MKALIIIVCLVILAPLWMPLGLSLLGLMVEFWWLSAIVIGVMLFGDINVSFGSIGGRPKSKLKRLTPTREELWEEYRVQRGMTIEELDELFPHR